MIAFLLQYRGDREAAYKMAESIESIGFRHYTLHGLSKLEIEAANPGLIVD